MLLSGGSRPAEKAAGSCPVLKTEDPLKNASAAHGRKRQAPQSEATSILPA